MADLDSSILPNTASETGLQPAQVEYLSFCPYCKKALETTVETACPHCGLPLRRRKRQRQMTAHGGALAKIIIQMPGGESKELLLSRPVMTLGRRRDHLIQLESPIMADDHARIEFPAVATPLPIWAAPTARGSTASFSHPTKPAC